MLVNEGVFFKECCVMLSIALFWQYLCKNELDCELWTAGVLRSFFYDLLMSLRNSMLRAREVVDKAP